MPTYQRKNASVEARQYEGPKLVVVSSLKGEQTAISGDYLVVDPVALSTGNLRGSLYVVPKVEFEAEFEVAPVVEPKPAVKTEAATTSTTTAID